MKDAIEILKIINDSGYEAYIVGGFSRDYYMNNISEDIDICTNAKEEVLNELFNITKRGFGSFILDYNNKNYEITIFRKELDYINNRYPIYEYTDALEEDINRRDFIINTLCIDQNGEYIDILGAKKDIDNKIIKCVGNSDIKIKEDALRILRALRFSVDLDFKIDESLKNSILKYKDNINSLSINRINKEIEKVKNKNKFNELINKYNITLKND